MSTDFLQCSVIILNHNGKHFLEKCITSVLRQDFASFEVILVDNGSDDGSIDFVKNNFPSVRIIALPENLGYAGGNNLGVEHARGSLIVLLNNDTVVERGWLQGLVQAVRPDRVAIVSSLIKTEGVPDRYYEKNGTINFLGHNVMRAYEEPTDIFFGGGASLIYKKDLLGIPFDADYFAYGEDVYLSLRARFLGYGVKHTNESRVYHYGSGTAKQKPRRMRSYYQERNRLLNTILFFRPMTLLRLIPFFILNVFTKLTASLVTHRWSFLGVIQSHVWLVTHPFTILAKRRALEVEKRVPERDVIAAMSGKLMNGENFVERAINACSLAYCRLAGLKTIELSKK